MASPMVRVGMVSATAALIALFCSCTTSPSATDTMTMTQGKTEMKIDKASFGKLPDGREADLYTLTNANGLQTAITNYGAIVVSLHAPDRDGKLADIVLGYPKLADYLKDTPYFGAIVGRYGNRIAKGRFTLDGAEYTLATNNDANHLHGGKIGFDKVLWDAEPFQNAHEVGLRLSYLSADGEEGYPGNLQVTVCYALTNKNELKITYDATTDKPTVVNLTHHGYWNLIGQARGDILEHELMLNADRFTPIDAGLIPTGELRPVKGTPMDFTRPTRIGARINQDDEQLGYGLGYDHNFVLNRTGEGLSLAARVYEATTGRVLEVQTTEPGVQFYSGNFLDGSNVGKGGRAYKHRYGFCLETQHFPDSPNKPEFPSVVLRPGQRYQTTTVYRFLAL